MRNSQYVSGRKKWKKLLGSFGFYVLTQTRASYVFWPPDAFISTDLGLLSRGRKNLSFLVYNRYRSVLTSNPAWFSEIKIRLKSVVLTKKKYFFDHIIFFTNGTFSDCNNSCDVLTYQETSFVKQQVFLIYRWIKYEKNTKNRASMKRFDFKFDTTLL